MTYKIITDDTGEEVCRSAIRSSLDPTMKNLREDPITIEEDPISLEDIISPMDAISNTIKSDAMNDVQGMHFRKPPTDTPTDSQNLYFKQTFSAPKARLPKRHQPNKQQCHERMPKLLDLHPKDPTTAPRRYPKRNNRTVKVGQTITQSDDTPVDDATNNKDNNVTDANDISIPPTDPTTPTDELQQQFLKNCDTHIDDQPDSFVYLRENGENENLIWKEFEVTLKDGNGNVKLGPDGKPMIAISPPPSDLCGRVFLTKPDERGEVKRARVVELIKDLEGEVAKNKDLIKFKLKYDRTASK
jgi:hypothetical protein